MHGLLHSSVPEPRDQPLRAGPRTTCSSETVAVPLFYSRPQGNSMQLRPRKGRQGNPIDRNYFQVPTTLTAYPDLVSTGAT
jgi:hypothetical protein